MLAFCYNYCVKSFMRTHYCNQRQLRNIMTTKNPVLYGDEISPPVRFVMMTASFLNIDLDFHKIDLLKSEHKSDFYTKINPLQKVPALFDGTAICDSHAIALYLCRICHDDDLYPQDLTLKSRIDEMLFFNSSTLFPVDAFMFSEFFAGKWPANDIQIQKWYSALDHVEHKLKQHKYLADDKVRLCDLCCATTVSSLNVILPMLDRHVRVREWIKQLEALPLYSKINSQGLKRLQEIIHSVTQRL